jgi:hypothetical protein
LNFVFIDGLRGRDIIFYGIRRVELVVIFSNIELITEIFQDCEETFDPVEVFIV